MSLYCLCNGQETDSDYGCFESLCLNMLTYGFLKHSCFILLKDRMPRDGTAALMSARELMLQ